MKKWLKHDVSNDFFLALARLNWRMRKFFAILGLIAILGSLLPHIQKTYAYSIPQEEQTIQEASDLIKYPTTTDEDFDISNIALIGEVDTMRTESSKTFQRVDGSFVIAMYSDAVHYQKDGKWENINNSLDFNNEDNTFTNQENSFKVKFPKTLDQNKSIKLTMDEYSISWSILSSKSSTIDFVNSELKSNNIKELTGINQVVTYNNVMNGVDIQYVLTGTKVKENIILEHYIKDFSITFEYSIKNLSLVETVGSYSFVKTNGEVVFDFASLFAQDQEGDYTDQISFEVVQVTKEVYLITLSLDSEWASKAVYPVTIDPSIQLPNDGYIRDTYLKEGSSTSFTGSAYIYSGEYLFTDYLGYLDFTVPTILKNYDVIYATLSLTRYNGSNTLYVHELSSYYGDFGSLTWNTRPTANQELIDFAYFSSSNTEYKLDITQSVNKWNKLGISEMPGFEFSTDGGRNSFYSINSAAYSPTIEIGFIDSNGIKDYWTYNSQDVSYAGTGYISDYTQDLYFVRNDVTFQTDIQSLGVSFVFNNNMAISDTPNIGYGIGWNINYNSNLYYDSPNAAYYTIDYTGNTVHYYSSSCDSRTTEDPYNRYSCYMADDGSGSKFVRQFTSSYILYKEFVLTSDNMKYSFDITYNDLISISSIDNDLIIIITRDSTNRNLITNISDFRGNIIDLTYGINGNLDSVTLKTKDDAGFFHQLEKVYYGYFDTTDFLHDVYFLTDYDQNGDMNLNLLDLRNVDRIVRYDNFGSNLLFAAFVKYIDETTGQESIGEKILYYYYSSTDPAVSYFESYYNSTKYSEVNYDYVENQTMITDYAGNFVLYSFDNYGHTVNLLDSGGNAVYYGYKDIFTDYESYVNGYPNYLENNEKIYQSSPQQMTYNPVEDYSFEDSSLSGWSGSGNFVSYPDQAKTGAHSLRIYNFSAPNWGYLEQSILLNKGAYSVSVDVLNLGTSAGTVSVQVGTQVLEVPYGAEWQKMTFTVPVVSDQTSILIRLESHNVGSVYFDNVIVSSGANPSWVNLVDNPSFENGLTFDWTITSGTTVNEYSINDQSGALNDLYEEVLGECAIGLNGEIFTTLQRNYFDGMVESGGTIYIGGWALNYTAPSINNANAIDGKMVRIYVEQYNYQSVIEGSQLVVPFNLSYDNWQYSFGDVSLFENCTSIKISVQYEGEGEVLFDGLSVFFVANTTSYAYDQYGRIENVYFDNGTIYTYSYAPQGEPVTHLIPETISDDKGHSITIESANNQVINVIKNNVKNSPIYNDFGQITGYNIISLDESTTYFSTSTSYDHFNQYLSSSTNEYGETTSYYTNVINGLLTHIENAKGVDTNYEYYDNGALKKVYVDNSFTNERTYVEYVYDEFNRLNQIILGENYSYYLNYDSFGRLVSVQVNNQTLMSYDYWVNIYETGMISSQTYINGDALYFEYDTDTNNITNILFRASGMTPAVRFQYEYDALGRVSVYRDILNEFEEQYTYDSDGNLSIVTYDNGDKITYEYDEEGNPSSITYSISNSTWSTYYDFDENVTNPDQYDQTSFEYASYSTYFKDYIYQDGGIDDPLGRLLKIEYHTVSNGFYAHKSDTIISYDENLTRINKLRFEFQIYPYRNFEYGYTYDELGNILSETYRTYNTTTLLYNDVVTKKYMYDDLNQLIQESVKDTRVDCTNTTNINVCYVKTYNYDNKGNITNQKTYKYINTNKFVVEGSMPEAYSINYGPSSMFLYYNVNQPYNYMYSIPVGGTVSLTFSYYDSNAYPLQRIYGVKTTLVSGTVDVNTPGYYLLEYRANSKLDDYILEFGIVVKVGDVAYGELVNEISFSYDATWLDQLDSYTVDLNGVSKTSDISYDLQGNPIQITNFYYNGIKYHHATLSWDGRQLVNIKIYSSTITKIAEIWYSYNDQGLRVSKILDTDGNGSEDKKYQYVWSGDIVISEIVSNYSGGNWVEQYQMNYIVDYDGSLIGFKYCVGDTITTYYYVLNLQGDVTKITSSSGYVYVEYTYDSYGNLISISGIGGNTYGLYNSYRYRSYKYDTDIGMYYLNSRYYNPEIGRFINSDGLLGQIGVPLSTNMYTYCANNPVMYTDPTGEITWKQVGTIALYAAITATVIGLTILTLGAGSAAVIGTVAAIGFGSGAVASTATQLFFNQSVDIGQVILDGLTGSMTACVSMLPMGALGVAAFGGIIGTGSYITSSQYNGTEITKEGMAMAFGIGFAAGLLSGGGYGYEKLTKYKFVSGMAKSFISPKKIAMYSIKASNMSSQMTVSIMRFAASLIFYEGVYTAYQNGELRIDFGGR